MKVKGSNGILEINGGLLMPTYEIKVSTVKKWAFVAEENGTTYFSFTSESSTQHVSLLPSEGSALKHSIDEITRLLHMPPNLDVAASRLNASDVLITADVVLSTVGLSAILLTMGS